MDMFDYYKLAFKKYADYEGRATLSEYWYFVLCHFLVSMSFVILIITGIANENEFMAIISGLTLGIYTLAAFIPSLMIAIRRLHDSGKSGWFLLFGFMPAVGGLILTILLAQKSDGDNQWGDNLEIGERELENEKLALPIIEYDDDFV